MTFQNNRNIGKLVDVPDPSKGGILAQCFPIYSLLLALNRTTVDYFSLDVEGSELQILKTIPFDKVNIKVLTVEYIEAKQKKKPIEDFMHSKGYISVMQVQHPAFLANDLVFIKIFSQNYSLPCWPSTGKQMSHQR